MSTLPKVKVKSHKTKVNIKAGTLPRNNGASVRFSTRRPVHHHYHQQSNIQYLKYEGKLGLHKRETISEYF